ncbi:hypothetical protein SLEP1_g47814 [Rubroshorea leprosula]|uniref:Uncharacterized protein n=1 Tax=Rubroshorea leprosula TaxID=152421 RepID=A0AAV5LRQ9_9ROSI|nr:hypothetical protein SLEP1_g47814 [Rubroshorea leprosula]
MSLDMVDNYLDVQEIDFQDPEDESYPGILYIIEVDARFTYFPNDEDDDVMAAMERVEAETFEVKAEDLTKTLLRTMFLSMAMPVDDHMMEKVLACANRMAQSDPYRNRKVRRMKVKLDIFVNDPSSSVTEVEAAGVKLLSG